MRRYSTTLSLLLLLWVAQPAYAGETLRPFSADYKLFEGGLHIANTNISLQRDGELWLWRMAVKARGVYSLFTSKEPLAETTFSNGADGYRIHDILVSDGSDRGKDETAHFDWDNGKIDVRRKGKEKQLPLSEEIYDYQSIHVLAAALRRQGIDKKVIEFYRKGRLRKSVLIDSGDGAVNLDGTKVPAYIFRQEITKSSSTTYYFYDMENPILPLRIEKHKSGESPSILLLQQVDWKQ